MVRRISTTRLKAILIINLIVVALAAGGYFYIQTQFGSVAAVPSKPAEFQLSNLTLSSPEVNVGQPITISVNVTNTGEEAGTYSINLTINDAVKETKAVQLSGSASNIVEFEDIESKVGSYSVKIGDLNATFKITAAPSAASFSMYALLFNPEETWANEPIQITVKVINFGQTAGNYPVNLTINDEPKGNQTVQVPGGATITVKFTVTEPQEGTYTVKLGTLTRSFNIVPKGFHTLSIDTNPRGARSSR